MYFNKEGWHGGSCTEQGTCNACPAALPNPVALHYRWDHTESSVKWYGVASNLMEVLFHQYIL